ncbi:uncharacterized protein FYW23_008932 [Sylvia borin]
MAPLREAVGPQGDRIMVKVPFSPNDLMIWKQSAGSYRKDPDRIARVVKMVIKTQNPDWNDLQVLLDIIMDSTEKEMVFRVMSEKAQEMLQLQVADGTLNDLVPREDPEWDPNSTEGYRRLKAYQKLLIEGVRAGIPKTLNWSKLYSMRQEKNESPSAFLERLKEAARRFTNLEEIFCFRVGRPREGEEEATHLVSSASRIQKLTYNIWKSIGSGVRRMEDNSVDHRSAEHVRSGWIPGVQRKGATAEFLRAEEDTGELAHDCVEVIEQVYASRKDLKDEPLENPDWELFTDGSSFVENGTRYAGYAVVTLQQTIEAQALMPGTSTQKAEVWALARALILSQGKRMNIWTDSKYAFGVVHVHGALWKERGLLNSQGSLIKHREEVKVLLEAIHRPQAVAVMHVRGHQNEEGKIFQGNRLADQAAKKAAREVWTQLALLPTRTNLAAQFMDQQPFYSPDDEKLAAFVQARKNLKGWYITSTEQVVLPQRVMKTVLEIEHNKCHWGAEALTKFLRNEVISNQMLTMAKRINAMCPLCIKNNPVVRKQVQMGKIQMRPQPGDYWQVDFSELPKAQGYKYLLVCVCTFSRWPEAFPCRTNQAKEVIKTLLKEIT